MANKNDFSGVKAYNGQAAPAKQDNLTTLQNMLAKNIKALTSVLPAHITPQRVARVALSTVRRNPQLMKCVPVTLFMGILEASTLGLELDSRGLAYLVPYFNKKTETYDAQFQIGYKGLIELAFRSGKVQSIQASVVGENDKFDYALGLSPRLEHIPNLKDRGEIIAAYAIAIMKDGAVQFEVMSKKELDKVRESSKASDSGPWVDWTEEMQKKVVLKRLCKLLPLSPEIQRAASLDDQADAGVSQNLGEMIDEAVIDIPVAQPAPEPEPEKLEQEKEVDASYSFDCAKEDKKVTEADCKECQKRDNCSQWEIK